MRHRDIRHSRYNSADTTVTASSPWAWNGIAIVFLHLVAISSARRTMGPAEGAATRSLARRGAKDIAPPGTTNGVVGCLTKRIK